MARNWIGATFAEGTHSRQAHCDLPADSFEREMGKEGFFGPVSHFYHRHPPTAWCDFEGPLRPRAFDASRLSVFAPNPAEAEVLLQNAHCTIRYWRVAEGTGRSRELFRNADGDDLLFVHAGSGDLFCDFGHLCYRDGDYILLPRGTMWRIVPDQATEILLIEATNGAYRLPDRGMLGPTAIFDPASLEHPALDEAFRAQQDENRWRVRVKRGGALSTITYPFNPLDAMGWKGDLCALRINWRDLRPVTSHRYHLPPSVHTTFVADRFVVCTFAPRPIETDPGALKVPFFHNNDDFDELIFYHRGEFFSRDDIAPGMFTFHPAGFTHGPHPGALAASEQQPATATEEVAVMIDCRDALQPTAVATSIERADYVRSWGGYEAQAGREA